MKHSNNPSDKTDSTHLNLTPVLLLLVLLCIAYVAYFPGFSGGFMLDDVSVLRHLAIIDGSFSFEAFLNFITYTDTGPLKRPISMASFLFDGQSWPATAESFKRTNVIIHLINGSLLFTLLFQIVGKHPEWCKHQLLIVGISTACWLLNPFLVSTTLYVVQRMAMLSAFFILLGLNLYIKLRISSQTNNITKTLLMYVFVVYGFTLLAVLSKESGILMLGMLPLFEALVCRKALSLPPLPKSWRVFILWVPVVILVFAFIVQIPGFMERYDFRTFSWTERLLSQPRALGHYLVNLYLPQRMTEGVFTDGFVVSSGWFQPFETWIWFVFHTTLLAGAVLMRSKWPLLCFAVLFFYLGHLIESTIVPLEMYFEHRNYLPTVFLFIPLALFCVMLLKRAMVFMVFPAVFILLMTAQLYFKSTVWGDNLLLHHLSMQAYPNSERAVTLTAMKLSELGRHQEALAVVKKGSAKIDSIALQSNVLLQSCFLNVPTQEEFDDVMVSVTKNKFTKDDIKPFEVLFDILNRQTCALKVSDETLGLLLEKLKNNQTHNKPFVQALYHMLNGKLRLLRFKQPELAMLEFKQSLSVGKNAYLAMKHVELLASNHGKKEAKQLLDAINDYLDAYSGSNKSVLLKQLEITSKTIES